MIQEETLVVFLEYLFGKEVEINDEKRSFSNLSPGQLLIFATNQMEDDFLDEYRKKILQDLIQKEVDSINLLDSLLNNVYHIAYQERGR